MFERACASDVNRLRHWRMDALCLNMAAPEIDTRVLIAASVKPKLSKKM